MTIKLIYEAYFPIRDVGSCKGKTVRAIQGNLFIQN